jgi:aminopeptidase YwaD
MVSSEGVQEYLKQFCLKYPDRRVGSQGNRAATDLFVKAITSFGWQIELQQFECLDWSQNGVSLTVNGERFEAFASPYSLGCQLNAPLVVVSTIEELEAEKITDRILLLRGKIARGQIMPKNFPFYNPDEHKHIIHLLETKKPGAIIAATAQNPEMAGAVYPFPLIEDGDFDIPSVYMTEKEGDRLAENSGLVVELESLAGRRPSSGCNAIARKGESASQRIILTAHIDSKLGTPGALDNASGAVTLIILAELLKDYDANPGIEIALLNGEDYYASSGEILYLQRNHGKLNDIQLAVNMDAAGYIHGKTAYSFYGCPERLAGLIRKTFSSYADLLEGEQWYQSDHMIFAQNHVPAVAITSEHFKELCSQITHTPKDRPELVDSSKLIKLAFALRELVISLHGFQF